MVLAVDIMERCGLIISNKAYLEHLPKETIWQCMCLVIHFRIGGIPMFICQQQRQSALVI